MYCISIKNKIFCTGCSACINICPTNAVLMQMDEKGFMYPQINEELCINCKQCFGVCPEFSENYIKKQTLPKHCYAGQHLDTEILMNSTSGGAFSAIVAICGADIVYGAIYNDGMEIAHVGIEKYLDFGKFRKSKYVQSNLGNIFQEIKKKLLENKKIVFSGTPCQIAGLKKYLDKDNDENLFCVELLCHGVSSPGVFAEYIQALENKYGSKISSMGFREKVRKRGMWKNFLSGITLKTGKKIFRNYDLFTQGYLQGLFLRECCYKCHYASKERIGDIVIGDFWSIDGISTYFNSELGVSLIIPITKRGENIANQLHNYMKLEKHDIKHALNTNSALIKPTQQNHQRDKFFASYKNLSINLAISNNVQKPTMKRYLFSMLPYWLRRKFEKYFL